MEYSSLENKFGLVGKLQLVFILIGMGIFLTASVTIQDFYWHRLPWLCLVVYLITAYSFFFIVRRSSQFREYLGYHRSKSGILWNLGIFGSILNVIFLPIFTTVPMIVGLVFLVENNFEGFRKKTEQWTITKVEDASKDRKCLTLKHSIQGSLYNCNSNPRWWNNKIPIVGDKVEGTIITGNFGIYVQDLNLLSNH